MVLTIDLHDLAALILHAHATVDGTPFPHARLFEISKNGAPFRTFPPEAAPPEWSHPTSPPRRVAYVLCDVPGADKTTVETFSWPDGVCTADEGALTRRELEHIWWRCKTYDQGFLLADVAQRVLDTLPDRVRVRARTAAGDTVLCSPRDFMIGNAMLTPREACAIVHFNAPLDPATEQTSYAACLSGFDGPVKWPYLILGPIESSLDDRVVLDLGLSQIGGRGLGRELFALERYGDYMQRVLPKYAVVHEVLPLTVEIVPFSASDETRARATALSQAVLLRVLHIAEGKETDFCRYCWQEGVLTHCGAFKTAHFCEPCHKLAWKYHKVWCGQQ
ncbi:hypothetical protein OH77DRAFT_1508637 [Trametes cingulata]|nr:hypothetical protein OH77DRAFT_1508637 [Trametes cingulata]